MWGRNTTQSFVRVPTPLRPVAEVLALLGDRQKEHIVLACRRPEPSKAMIADLMHVAVATVNRHCEDVYRILEVHSKLEFYDEAIRLGLVKCPCERAREAHEQAKGEGKKRLAADPDPSGQHE